ncbi:hypothetical protein [Roseospira visakhapatnamensis]|uniref:Lipoprotein n=1 Tax=Roseospira visakhapatnamensis TaxID=390880 RepID=A0A7W6R9U7_9PROT|nr:hypothetical protein [Roseospira visakhapatnamensis]MBB4264548.1 hypothetical protein [Roseospira visakhapatnamensis]
MTPRLGMAVVALGVLAGCASSGDIADPVTRKLTWFSFLNGDDIRATCAPGAPLRVRLVHNADYMVRVRVYDLVEPPPAPQGPPPGSLVLMTRVLGPTPASLTVDPAAPGLALAPLGGRVARRVIGPGDAARLRAALEADGLDGGPPTVRRLDSHEFWWLAVGCLDGRMRIQAWADPDPGYAALTAPARLRALDGTGIPIRTPADEPHGGNPVMYDRARADKEVRFRLSVGPEGINGPPRLP